MFSRIWAQHKKFILMAGSSLAVFLMLHSCVSSFSSNIDGPKGLYARGSDLEREGRRLRKELARYSAVKASLEEYRIEEEKLRSILELASEPEVESFDAAAPLLQFEKALDRVWGGVEEKANRAGILLPQKLTLQDFGVSREDGKAEYEDYYAYLGVVRRALTGMIESGVARIGQPELEPPDLLPVLAGDESTYCLFRQVRVSFTGSFESVLKTLEGAQKPGDFLQVRIINLVPTETEEADSVQGELAFVGFRFVGASYLSEKRSGGSSRGRRGRGGRRW